MRYYRYRRKASQKAKTIFFRILFILAAAVLVTGFAVLTGNLLLQKVENAEEQLESSVPPSGNAAGREENTPPLTTDGYSSLNVFASGLDLILHDTEDSLFARVHTIAQTYNTVSVEVTRGGELVYVSPALSTLLRMPDTGVNTEFYTRLLNTITAAKAQNLRLSAVMSSSLGRMDNDTAALIDSTIAAELYVMGFDEILFTDLLTAEADTDAINNARRYLQAVHDALSGTGSFSMGACLPSSIYLDAENAKQVQMLSSVVDFLAMDASALTVANTGAMTLSEVCAALAGNFEVYNLRVVLKTADPVLLSAQYNTLVHLDITNVQFIRETTPESMIAAEIPEIEIPIVEAETEESIPTTNPYATTSPKDEAGNPIPTETEPEETYYKTEGDSWY
ncbi:MAG: hypothetical protein E7631_06205 [Ruminococcaceae bacterium]|nr:hypothetical protein [Oscillospiraceae bacterium]